jgi:iron complex outermembrane receptor protein
VANGFGESQGNLRDLDQLTQEIRLSSNGDKRLKWQVGAMYFDSRDITEFYQRAFFLTPPANNPNNWVRLHDINTSWGFFGQFSYELVENLTLTAGARWTNDTKKTSLLKVVNQPLGTAGTSVRLSDDQPSWDVSLLYKLNPDVSIYGRVARGFRGPTIQGRSAVFGSPFTTANSETILSAEAGIKTSLLDNRLRFNLSGFGYRVKNIQLNANDSNGSGVLFNADKAVAYGLEAELEAKPVRNLSLSAGLSLLHSEIQDKRVFAQVCSLNGVLVCSADVAFTKGTGTGTTYFASVDGQPLPNAPKYTANIAARYDLPLGSDNGSLFVATDWMFQGFTNFVLYKTSEFYSDGTVEGGLKVGYTADGGKYEIAAFARNITNSKNLKGVIENYMAAVFNEPRIIGVSLSGKF